MKQAQELLTELHERIPTNGNHYIFLENGQLRLAVVKAGMYVYFGIEADVLDRPIAEIVDKIVEYEPPEIAEPA